MVTKTPGKLQETAVAARKKSAKERLDAAAKKYCKPTKVLQEKNQPMATDLDLQEKLAIQHIAARKESARGHRLPLQENMTERFGRSHFILRFHGSAKNAHERACTRRLREMRTSI